MNHSGREAQILGHLLFCYEVVRAAYRVPASDIRLLVLADYDATPLWHRAAAHLDVPVGFYNILGVVRGRLSSQNVLGIEQAQSAAGVERGGADVTMARTKKLRLLSEEEYNLSDDLAAELKRFVSKLTGRRVTGALTVHLADGGINSVKLQEVVRPAQSK
jgi:hypothetical protein